jgi:hypothetical protein
VRQANQVILPHIIPAKSFPDNILKPDKMEVEKQNRKIISYLKGVFLPFIMYVHVF